jgi:hypothetical protein
VKQYVPTMTVVSIVVQQYIQTVAPVPLLHSNDPGHASCLPPKKNTTDRQTYTGHQGVLSHIKKMQYRKK